MKQCNELMKANGAFAFLKQCEDNSYDIVYLDPMFEETVIESDGIKGIKTFRFVS